MSARKPTPDEAALLAVYRDAEAAVLAEVTARTASVLDGVDRNLDPDWLRYQAAQELTRNVGAILQRSQRKGHPLIRAILAAARGDGIAQALLALVGLSGGGRSRYDDTGIDRASIDRLAAAVLDRVTPAYASVLRTTLDHYRTVTARAVPGVLAGSDTRREATQRSLWQYADSGVTGFTDVSGRRWTLSAYSEMAVRTAAARATEDAKHDRLREAGVDLVIVQASADRCPLCRPWAGKILTLDGQGARSITREHATKDGVMVDVQVAGSVVEARAAGWNHPQCRCSSAAYLPGVTRIPAPIPDEGNGQYEARQRQRAIERQIRHWKARETASLDDPARTAARTGVRAAQARMRAHLADNPDLLRRSYREQLGTGNKPTSRTRPPDAAIESAPRQVRDMFDDELDHEMQAALSAEDMDRFELLAEETDRREEVRDARKAKDQARRDAREEARAAAIERLVDEGFSDEEAVAEVTGKTVEAQRRSQAIVELRAQGYRGKGFDELSRTAWKDWAYSRYDDAEAATNGYMVNDAGRAANFGEASLFTAPEAQVRKYATPEMLEWFDQNGRPDLAEFRAQLLGDSQAAYRLRNQRGDFLQ